MNRLPDCENAEHFAGSDTAFVSAVGVTVRALALLLSAVEYEFDVLLAVPAFVAEFDPMLNEHAVAKEVIRTIKRKRACFICTIYHTNSVAS